MPQLDILQRATAFVSHGGMNSTMESLYYGVPMVVIPQMPEQAMTARRVDELGLGLMLDKNTLTPRVCFFPLSASWMIPRSRHGSPRCRGYKRAADAIITFAS